MLPYDTIVQMVSGRNFYLGTAAANTLFGSAGLLIVGSAMVLAIFNSLNGCVMVFPRLYYAWPATARSSGSSPTCTPSTRRRSTRRSPPP